MKTTSKKTLFKRGIATLLALVMVVTMQGAMNFSAEASAEDDAGAESYIETKVVAQNDYSTAGSFGQSSTEASSRNITPSADPLNSSNKVLNYWKSYYRDGAIFLGSDYKVATADTMFSGAIKVEKGVSYHVQYDYYLTGSEHTEAFTMYLTAGTNSGSELVYDTTNAVILEQYAANVVPTTSGWVTKTATITIPSDYDTTTYPYLMICCTWGGGTPSGSTADKRMKAYFDNITVRAAYEYSGTVIAENDYSTANTTWDEWNFRQTTLGVVSGIDPFNSTNKVIRYKQYIHGVGAVYFGATYTYQTYSGLQQEVLGAVAGKTYTVQYDYYTSGTANVALNVYLTTGSTYIDSTDANKNNIVYNSTTNQPVLNFAQGTDLTMSGWKRNNTVSITIPAGENFTNGNYLMFRVDGGGIGDNRAQIYFDNIKVTEASSTPVSPIQDEELSSKDYSKATTVDNTWVYLNYSGNIWPVTDPLDDTNKVLQLSKSSTSDHQIIIGADYSNANNVKDCTTTITPIAGASYEIEFDWYTPDNPGSNDIIVYAAVGPITIIKDAFTSDYANATCYDYQTEILRISAADKLPDTWQTAKATVTIPKDTAITAGNILLLYVRADVTNGTGITYFDNIKVSRLAPISAELNVDGQSSSEIYTAGRVPSDKYPVTGNEAMMWYSDETRNHPFSINDYDSEYPEHIVLYGNYEVADKSFVVGDLNGDSLATDTDLSSLRQHLLGATVEGVEDRADTTRNGSSDVRDLVRLKLMEKGELVENFKVNGSATYSVVVPSSDANYTDKNKELVADYIGTAVVDTTAVADYEIIIGNAERDGVRTISSATSYSIIVEGNKVYVNGGSDKALGAAILALHGCMDEGRNMTDGYALDFEYISPEHPADTVGIVPENIYTDDFVTTKNSVVKEAGAITNPAATLSLANGSISDSAIANGTEFATKINANKIADFEKSGDKMVHVSTFAIINEQIYMTYYANASIAEENPLLQDARFVYAPLNDPMNKTYIDLQKHGDICFGKKVVAVYDTILLQKDADTLYLMWTAKLDDNYYRLYRKYTISTDTLGPIGINRFKVGDITNDFSVSGIKSALTENEIAYKDMYSDIGIMQKPTTRVENGETYYYTGAYCGDFNCIIKSKDMVTWEYVAQPDFINQSKWENATYVIGDKCYYYVRQYDAVNNVNADYGFLTCYDLVNETWATPVLIEDVQSRSDFIVYNDELYLFYAPENQDNIAERQHIGIVKVDQNNLANSEIVVHAYMKDSCFYPFVQYDDKGNLYMSYTIWRKHIRLAKFDLGEILGQSLDENF